MHGILANQKQRIRMNLKKNNWLYPILYRWKYFNAYPFLHARAWSPANWIFSPHIDRPINRIRVLKASMAHSYPNFPWMPLLLSQELHVLKIIFIFWTKNVIGSIGIIKFIVLWYTRVHTFFPLYNRLVQGKTILFVNGIDRCYR